MEKWSVLQERAENWHLNQLYLPATSYTWRLRKVIGTDYGALLTVFHDAGGFAVHAPAESIPKFEGEVLKLIERNPKLVFRFSERFKREINEFLEYCKTFSEEGLGKKELKELGELFNKYYKTYFAIYSYSEPLPFGFREILSIKLEMYLKKLLNERGESGKFGEYYALLTSSPKKPFATKEEEDLLKMSLKIAENEKISKLLVESWDEAYSALKDYIEIDELLQKHTDQYYWLPFDYAGKSWNKRHFLKTIRDYQTSGFDAYKRLQQIQSFYSDLEKRQSELAQRIGIDKHMLMLFEVLQEGSYLIDYKKEQFTKAHFYLKMLMSEIAKRLGTEWLQLCYVTPPELVEWCVEGKGVPVTKIKARMKICVLYDNGTGKNIVLEGEEADKFLKKEGINFKNIHTPSEVKGICACAGNITGRAKIVRTAKELSKLEKGDVLVAYMTTPDFVRGMKIAVAIVTDEGGLTSHAAIVSREFGIPCVVGTKIGSKVFKDGDLLEVKASHGVVRKIK